MRKRPRRPRPAARKLITAAELARRRGVDDRTIRRWRTAGCPVARRGKPGHTAPLFDESKISAWLQKNETDERQMVGSLISLTDSRARRARNDFRRLVDQYVNRADVAAIWPAFVASVRTRAHAIIDPLASRLVDVAAHPSTPELPRDRRILEPAEILAIIATDAARPWKSPAEPAIRAFAERGVSIEINARGHWSEQSPTRLLGAPRPQVPPVRAVAEEIKRAVHALLTELAKSKAATRDTRAAPPTVRPSKTLRSARAQLAEFQTRLVTLRDAIAGQALAKLDDVQHGYVSRVYASRAHFLNMQTLAPEIARLAEDVHAVRAVLARAVAQGLAELEPRPPSRKEETT